MPLWVTLSLLAGVAGSISNILYRITLKESVDASVTAWFLQVLRLICALVIIVWFGISFDLRSVVILTILGLIEVVGMYAYMRMHAASALSVSAIVQRSRIIWTAILAAMFVGETFTPMQIGGLLVLFLGVSAVAAPHTLRTDKGVQFALLSAFLFSVTTIMIKATIGSIPPAAQVAGLAFPSIFIFPMLTKSFGSKLKQFTRDRIWLKFFAALGNVAVLFLTVYAFAIGPAAKISAIFQGSLVISVFGGIILLGERDDMHRKLFGAALVISGIIATSYGY